MKKIILVLGLFMFSLNVQAIGHNLEVELLKPNDYEGPTIYEVTNNDTGDTLQLEVRGVKEKFSLPDDYVNVTIKELERDSHYIADLNIYNINYNESINPLIYHRYELKQIKLIWYGFYYSTKRGEYIHTYYPELSFYNKSGELVFKTKDNNITIPAGAYVVKEDVFNKSFTFDFTEDSREILTQNIVDFIWTEEKIESICNKEKCFPFVQEGNLVRFTSIPYWLIPGEYIINGQNVLLSEYLMIENDGPETILKVDLKKEEVPTEENKPEDEISKDDDLSDKSENIPVLDDEGKNNESSSNKDEPSDSTSSTEDIKNESIIKIPNAESSKKEEQNSISDQDKSSDSESQETDNSINTVDYISVDVPNTGLEKTNENIYYIEKKYYSK